MKIFFFETTGINVEFAKFRSENIFTSLFYLKMVHFTCVAHELYTIGEKKS